MPLFMPVFLLTELRGLVESSIGTYLDSAGETSRSIGTLSGVPFAGFFWTAPADGEIRRVLWKISSGADGDNFHAEHWAVSGNSPSFQIGNDTPAVVAANGWNTYSWSSPYPAIVSGTRYCSVLVSDGGDGNFTAHSDNASFGSDRDASAITSLDQTAGIDGFNNDWTVELVVATRG